MKKLLTFIKLWFQKLKRRRLISQSAKMTDEAVQELIKKRRALRRRINIYLRAYFKVDAKSKYIPPDYKNNEEVKVSVMHEFGEELKKLSLSYDDLFK